MNELINRFLGWADLCQSWIGAHWPLVWNELTYDPLSPILFSSGLFLWLFLFFVGLYRLLQYHRVARAFYVTLFSLFFYYKSSGLFFCLLILVATTDFFIAQAVYHSHKHRVRKLWVALTLLIDLGLLGYFKYFNFFRLLIMQLMGESDVYEPLDIFLPVGISFFTFQSISYVIDVYRERIQPLRSWLDYLFYVSFFPQLVAGPIVRARDFIPQIRRIPTVTKETFGEGLFLILCGLIKKTVVSDYISLNFVDRVFDAPLLYSGLENLIGIYGYTLQIYCDFSGYSDMAIGIALLLGFRFNVNFDAPYQSATITEFWRRWHISLSSWLKDYLYISLGGNRRGRLRTYLNLMITMLLGGLWHGASLRFVLWGAWHGLLLAVHKAVMSFFPSFRPKGDEMPVWRMLIGVVFTFHLVAFGWIMFRATSMETVGEMLQQIVYHFHPELLMQFVFGYRGVVFLLVAGYLLHFIPRKLDRGMQQLVTRSPLILQALYLTIAIILVVQLKSASVQPFIYFQF